MIGYWEQEAAGTWYRWWEPHDEAASVNQYGWTVWTRGRHLATLVKEGPETGDEGKRLADAVLVEAGELPPERAFVAPDAPDAPEPYDATTAIYDVARAFGVDPNQPPKAIADRLIGVAKEAEALDRIRALPQQLTDIANDRGLWRELMVQNNEDLATGVREGLIYAAVRIRASLR